VATKGDNGRQRLSKRGIDLDSRTLAIRQYPGDIKISRSTSDAAGLD
jgi:hypothetical protein